MDEHQVPEVVYLDDAQQLAEDAASAALARQRAEASADLETVATDAAAAALDGVADDLAGVTDEHMQQVAESAAKAAADGVADEVVKSLEQGQEEDAGDVVYQVEIAEEQYQNLFDSLRVQNTSLVLALLVQSCLLGVLLVRYFVDGWRK